MLYVLVKIHSKKNKSYVKNITFEAFKIIENKYAQTGFLFGNSRFYSLFII